MYLVTGGARDGSTNLASTELLRQGAGQTWVTVTSGALPSPRKGLRGATLGNKVIVTGEMRVSGAQASSYHHHRQVEEAQEGTKTTSWSGTQPCRGGA